MSKTMKRWFNASLFDIFRLAYLLSTPSPLTSSRLNAWKVLRISSSFTFPKRTNIARANISRVHSFKPSVRFADKRSLWINGPDASSRRASSSRRSPNFAGKKFRHSKRRCDAFRAIDSELSHSYLR